MVLHARLVHERNEGIPGSRGGLVKLCSRRGLLGMHLKFHKCPTSVRNENVYEYISIDNIQLVQGLLKKKPKNKTIRA